MESTYFNLRLYATRLLARVPHGARGTGKWLFARDDVDEEVELVGFGEGLGDVGAGEGAALVRVGDDECAGGYF